MGFPPAMELSGEAFPTDLPKCTIAASALIISVDSRRKPAAISNLSGSLLRRTTK
jgi:hypothetical protein